MEDALPTEVWLYTDIEGSTRFWQAYLQAMPSAYRLYDEIIRSATDVQHGVVVSVAGDAFQARFPSSEHAVMAAIRAQRRLQAEDWPLPEPLRVRMALHAATCGREVPALTIWHELGMVLGAAHSDQIIATEAAVSRADAADGDWRWRELGKHLVRGMAEEISLYQVVTGGLRDEFPPLRTRSTHPHNLPAIRADSHFEPEAEAEIQEHFAGESRWVTLIAANLESSLETGVSSAWKLLPRFPNGAFLTVVNGSLTHAMHSSLAVEAEIEPAMDDLISMIGRQQVLLVVFGMETSAEGVSQLAEVMARCPRLHVIVVASEPLQSRWERLVYLADS